VSSSLHEIIEKVLVSILITARRNGVWAVNIIISMISLPGEFFALFGYACFFFLLRHMSAHVPPYVEEVARVAATRESMMEGDIVV
jgi:hypothetical protein